MCSRSVAPTRFNICHVWNNDHAAVFDGGGKELCGALRDLGYECGVRRNEALPGAVNILVGPFVFVWPYRGHVIPSILDRRYVLYQAEQLHERQPMFRKLAA